MDNVINLHGLFKDIVSDHRSIFKVERLKERCQQHDINRWLRSAYYPQTICQMEETNGIVKRYLRAYVNYQQENWTELLATAEFTYNNSYQDTIRMSPFDANYGQHSTHEPMCHMIAGDMT